MSRYHRRRRRRLRRPWRRSLVDHLLTLALAVSVTCAVRPAALDLGSQMSARAAVSRMSSSTDATMDPRRIEALREAQAYNMRLGGPGAHPQNKGLGGSNGGERDILSLARDDGRGPVRDYASQLGWRDVDAFCWVEIPACGIVEPVYHGTADETLAQGVGHLETSSLPVGGASSNCVLAAHSGMERSRMFDDLETLGQGDLIVIHTLGDAYWYEVVGTEVVLPEVAEERCGIVAGEDLCTLVTCTPYGINSHRLLIHGRRVPVRPEASGGRPVAAASVLVGRRALPVTMLCAGFVPLATLRAWGRLRRLRRRRRARRLLGGA